MGGKHVEKETERKKEVKERKETEKKKYRKDEEN